MENKVVCYYCGTVYNEEDEKCPLCGGRSRASEAESVRPVRRERLTEQERRQRRRAASKGGRYSANKKVKPKSGGNTRTILIAALVLLALAVVVVTWFIGDMIGWWGGLENSVERDTESVSTNLDAECTLLEVSSDTIRLENIGDSAELYLNVNVDCTQDVSLSFPDAAIAAVEIGKETAKGNEIKTDTFTITAVSEGVTRISFTCGELSAACDIYVGSASVVPETTAPEETEESSQPAQIDEDYEPELNFPSDVSLYQRGESVPLRITNLPEGAAVTWHSADETIAKVDAYGVVTAISGGSTTVTAEVAGRTVEVLVRCPFDQSGDIGAHLEYTDVTIKVGESYYLYLLDIDDYRITDVTYEMDEEGVCSIDDGKVTGIGSGTIVITITYNTQEYECIVRVRW